MKTQLLVIPWEFFSTSRGRASLPNEALSAFDHWSLAPSRRTNAPAIPIPSADSREILFPLRGLTYRLKMSHLI